MNEVIQKIRKDLINSIGSESLHSYQKYFKEPVKCYGIKTGIVNTVAKEYWQEVRDLKKSEILNICEELLSSDYCEEAFIVSAWMPKMVKKFEREDLAVFKRWIYKYLNNWAKIDSFCNHTVGDFIEKFPESISEVKSWGKSENRWLKRASAVSLIVPVKHGKYLQDVFVIADQLLIDKDDMVQKGYGWLLKEASRQHQKDVFDYVMKNKKLMPRTALRYAIELMPQELKSEAMQRNF